jgi:predicted nucleic acid-binding protein
VIVLDTSGLLAALDQDQPDHEAAARCVENDEPRLPSPFVLAELDYLLGVRVGQGAETEFLGEVARGVYRLASLDAAEIDAARAVIMRYADLHLGLADASIVVIAHRYGCHDLLTLDERHFRAVVGLDGKPFRLLPMDMPSR